MYSFETNKFVLIVSRRHCSTQIRLLNAFVFVPVQDSSQANGLTHLSHWPMMAEKHLEADSVDLEIVVHSHHRCFVQEPNLQPEVSDPISDDVSHLARDRRWWNVVLLKVDTHTHGGGGVLDSSEGVPCCHHLLWVSHGVPPLRCSLGGGAVKAQQHLKDTKAASQVCSPTGMCESVLISISINATDIKRNLLGSIL